MNNLKPKNYTTQNLLFFYKRPWGMWLAEDWNGVSRTIPDSSGNNRGNMTTTTTSFTKSQASGNGATAAIDFITITSTTATCLWPVNSIPANYTIACLCGYTTNTTSRNVILTSSDISTFILGHWNPTTTPQNGKGRVYLGSFWNSDSNSVIVKTSVQDWQITIAKNQGQVPTNVLIDGIPRGTATGGLGNGRLGINNSPTQSKSICRFSAVVVYDSILLDTEMVELNSYFQTYLDKGTSLKTYLNNVPLTYLYNTINYPIIKNPLNTYTSNALLVKRNGDNYMTSSLLVNGYVNANQPRWSAFVNGSGTTAIGNITYDTSRFTATNVNFNLSTGYVIITVPGRYLITFNGFSVNSGSGYVEVRLYKNFNQITRNYSNIYTVLNRSKAGMNLYAILDLLEGDYININVQNIAMSFTENSYFCGYLIY